MYSAREVADIIGIQESRVRYWAQTGFVGPSTRQGARPAYTFQDLVGVKAAKELLERGLTVQRVRRSLEALRAQLPGIQHPLSQLRIVGDGAELLVLHDATRYEPVSGQLVMDFDLAALEGRATEIQIRTLAKPPATAEVAPAAPTTAWGWFRTGLACVLPADAAQAFEQALALDPNFAAAHTNLGTAYDALGRPADARVAYQRALELDPEQPEARYNLGNLHEQAGDLDRALGEWYHAIAIDSDFADAHFNLGVALVEMGATDAGQEHLRRYLALRTDDSGHHSEWAARARSLLSEHPEREDVR